MTPIAIVKIMDTDLPISHTKSEKLKPRRERRRAAREADRMAKLNGLQQAIAAKSAK